MPDVSLLVFILVFQRDWLLVANVTGFEIFEAAATDSTTYDLSFLRAANKTP